MSNETPFKSVLDTLVSDFNTSLDAGGKTATRPSYYDRPANSAEGQFVLTPNQTSDSGEYTKGLMRSVFELPGLAAGTGAYLADIVGADNARDAMLAYAKKSNQEVQDKYGSENASFSDVLEGKASLGGFVKNASGYVTGQALQFLLTGGIGAGVARGLLKGGAVAAADKLVASELAKGASEEAAKKVAADFMVTEAKRTGLLGATTAGGAQNFNMELGSIYPDAVDQAKSEGRELDAGDKFRVGASALGAAATDTAMDRLALGKVLGGSKAGGNVFSRAAREIPAGALREGTTEGIQTEMERYGAGKSLTDADAMRDVIDSAAVGAIGGVQAGGLTSLHKAPVPPELQHVADKAAEANSPLSKAAMAGNAGALSGAATQNGNDQTQSGNDPISARVAAVVNELETTDALQKLRNIGPGMGAENLANDFLYALQVARDPRNRADVRQQAMDQVEQAIEWTKTGFTMPQEQPQQPGTAVALRENNAVGPVGQAQFFDPNTIDGEAVRVDNMIGGPRALPGPQRGLTTQEAPAQEQVAPAVEPVASPVEQQNVAPATANVSPESTTVPVGKTAAQAGVAGMTEVQAPRVEIPAGTGPAVLRKRAAVVKQLAENGFETVQRDGKDFYMVNSKTGQKFKLDGPADAQLARKAINDRIDAIAHTAAASPKNDLKEPTQAQIDAGNYKKSDVIELNGMKIKIENPQGSVRRGVGPDGKAWETKMAHHYGEFQGTVGADGDKLDVFLGPRKDSDKIYVIDQVNKDGSFDEHKVMMGFTTEADARQGYLANYEKGWTGLGAITEMSPEQFKEWAKSRAAKKPAAATLGAKPAGQSKPLEAAAAASQEQFTEAEKAEDAAPQFTYVRDEKGQHKLRIVKPGELQKKASGERTGKYRELTQGEAKTLEQVAAIIGRRVVFFDPDAGFKTDGFVRTGDPSTIYINKKTSINPLAVFGHEFFHTLRETNPRAWDAISAVVASKVGPSGAKRFRADRYGKAIAEQRGATELSRDNGGELEELVSDLGGNLLKDSKFWGEVFAKINEDNGAEAKGIIAKLSAALQRAITRLVNGLNQRGFAADSFVKDLDQVRAAFRDAMAEHLKQTEVTERATAAEQAKGEQVKKSDVRGRSPDEQAENDALRVRERYLGTPEWMKAPNGKPTNLTERQWIQVRTPQFKAWFGDWEKFAKMDGGVWSDDAGEVSKAVDANGEPLVVYHGTDNGGFSEFNEPGGTKRGDLGIFATPNRAMALTYVKKGRGREIEFADMERESIEGGDTPGYYASFMNIRNPQEDDFDGALWSGEREQPMYQLLDEDGYPTGDYTYTEEDAQRQVEEGRANDYIEERNIGRTTDDVVSDARRYRHDGVIIRNVIDDGGGYSSYAGEPTDVFVAFKPNQLKSATQNTGEFGTDTNDMRFSSERDEYIDPDGFNEFAGTDEDFAQAAAYEEEHGILPYVSEGQLQIPVELGDIKQSVKREGKYGNHPVFDIPVNANGTVTLYFPTTNEEARRIVRERTLRGASGADRVYLTNESGIAKVMEKMGNIDQDVDGANVLVQINPNLIHLDTDHEDGRKDFFIPIQEGAAFKEKMAQVKLFTQNAPRTKALSKSTKLTDLSRRITDSIGEYLSLDADAKRKRLREAKDVLRSEHNVSTLLGVNGKLEKTNVGGYGINNYNGKDVMSMGLGLASAQRINEQNLSTCPQSAICESLCLGETSGQNLLYGGEGQFKSGPRMSQYLKTEALVQHPEEFAIVLHAEIAKFARRSKRDDYQPTVRLNVTSDFRPQTFEAIINAFPDVMFYDYTKLPSKVIAKNHHLTYSSTGASQVVDGKTIINPESNWDKMVERMRNGDNVAMAFTNRNEMPKFVVDGKSGQRFQVWNGDNYDARFLDPKRKDGIGMIIGLTNKDRTTKPEQAAEKHRGFFMDYNPKRDGDTVVVADQERTKEAYKAQQPKVFQVARFSRDRKPDAYNQRIAALKDLISCLKK